MRTHRSKSRLFEELKPFLIGARCIPSRQRGMPELTEALAAAPRRYRTAAPGNHDASDPAQAEEEPDLFSAFPE
jgi:hypothetical protein